MQSPFNEAPSKKFGDKVVISDKMCQDTISVYVRTGTVSSLPQPPAKILELVN